MVPHCNVEVISDIEHVRQIYAGFSLLDRQGAIRLTQTIPASALLDRSDHNRWSNYKFYNVKVTIDERIKIVYDLHDWNWIDEKVLSEADFYFKRGFDPEYIDGLKDSRKIFPLGLNYPVSSAHVDFFKLRRAQLYPAKERLKLTAKSLRLDRLKIVPLESECLLNLEGEPKPDQEPRVLYMARLWDPSRIEAKGQAEAVERMNDNRAGCVLALRREFGDRFYGGLARDEFSLKNYGETVLPDHSLSVKRSYLKTLAEFPICIATTGLSGSNGWKLGEYVALSKAIITEPLVYRVPGNFAPESNYLEFRTKDDLIVVTRRIFDDRDLRLRLMSNNHSYYHHYVRPDSLVQNTLNIALGTHEN